ncbi:MAG: THUMP domain-containing class I SAM-dependent RNA methyltransferase [Saprospiraceae bacterium]
MRLIAKTLQGLEEVLAEELVQIGAQNIQIHSRSCSFEGDKTVMYRANLELRTALRILLPIWSSEVHNEKHIYEDIQKINWEKYLDVDSTFAVDSTVHSDNFTHSHYISLLTKDAIVDQFRDKFNARPSIDTDQPDLRIHVYISNETFEVSLDSSGESLHKRGYSKGILIAPINDVMAAGLIKLSGWKMDCDFMDPMCGSGTILLEAAMLAYNIPSLWNREYFGFKKWNNYDEELWLSIREEAYKKMKTHFPYSIRGYDIAYEAVHATETNCKLAGLKGYIKVERCALERQAELTQKTFIITNPPYDERIEIADTNMFYALVGDTLKKKFKGSEAWIITANLSAAKHIGLRTSRKLSLNNGGLDCKFLKFELYEGSRKTKTQEIDQQ